MISKISFDVLLDQLVLQLKLGNETLCIKYILATLAIEGLLPR